MERQGEQEGRENENKNRRGGIKWQFMKIVTFDMKSPENSGNWLGLFWVRSSGHISDCGMK